MHWRWHRAIILCYTRFMKFTREVVHSPDRYEQVHFSTFLKDAKPFAAARVKQGGYGVHDLPFYVQRVANRGFHVVVLSIAGNGLFTMEDGTTIPVGPGQLFVSWAGGQGHSEQTVGPEPWEIIWLTFWDDSPWFKAEERDWEVISFLTADALRGTVLNLLQSECYEDQHCAQMVELYEQILLIQLERALLWSESRNLSQYRHAFANLWSKVAKHSDRRWSVSDLCLELYYSRSQLTRICKQLYNRSPAQKVRELKMNQAEILLLNSTKSIGEIAQRVGYESISTFSTAFSTCYNMSPRAFREQGRG